MIQGGLTNDALGKATQGRGRNIDSLKHKTHKDVLTGVLQAAQKVW